MKMCEISKSQRRTYRDQDPPRILSSRVENDAPRSVKSAANDKIETSAESAIIGGGSGARYKRPLGPAAELSRGRDTAEATCAAEPFAVEDEKQQQPEKHDLSEIACKNRKNVPYNCHSSERHATSGSIDDQQQQVVQEEEREEKEVVVVVVVPNGIGNEEESDCGPLEEPGREMAPVMGAPPPPPPAPHMGPDGLILPKKPYNPCLISNNHKDLRRELLFNQKIGRNVLNQKSELARALEKHRGTSLRKEAEKTREESYKDDPRTALHRALEQRARHIQLTEQPQMSEPPNVLVNARAKLRTRTDSQ